jgi:sugar phosphate isomerase/epimerase
MTLISRRSLLAGAAAATAGLVAPARAIQPIVRPGRRRMRLSLAAYSFRDYLPNTRAGKSAAKPDKQGAMDLLGFVDWCAGQDLDAVELTSYFFPDPVTDDWIALMKRRCHVAGLDISGGAIANKFTLPAGPKLDEQFDYVKKWLDIYAKLGVSPIRFFAGVPEKGTSDQDAIHQYAIPALRKACEIAGKHGIFVALENHDYLSRVERILPIIKEVDSPWFGINVDTGNFDSDDPYVDIEKIAPYAVNVQVKVEIHPGGKKAKNPQPCDYKRIADILRKNDYSGYVVLEYESKEDPYTAVPKQLAALRQAIA